MNQKMINYQEVKTKTKSGCFAFGLGILLIFICIFLLIYGIIRCVVNDTIYIMKWKERKYIKTEKKVQYKRNKEELKNEI